MVANVATAEEAADEAGQKSETARKRRHLRALHAATSFEQPLDEPNDDSRRWRVEKRETGVQTDAQSATTATIAENRQPSKDLIVS